MSTFSIGKNRSNKIESTTSNNPSFVGGLCASYMASPLWNWIKRSHMVLLPVPDFWRPEFRTWGICFLCSTALVWPEAHLYSYGTSLLSCTSGSNRNSLTLTQVALLLQQLAFPWFRLSRHGWSFSFFCVCLCFCDILPLGSHTRKVWSDLLRG